MYKVKHTFHTLIVSKDMAVPLEGGTIEVRTLEEALGWFRMQTNAPTNYPMDVAVYDSDDELVIGTTVGV